MISVGFLWLTLLAWVAGVVCFNVVFCFNLNVDLVMLSCFVALLNCFDLSSFGGCLRLVFFCRLVCMWYLCFDCCCFDLVCWN